MKNFLQLRGMKSSRKATFVLLAICGVSLTVAFFIGIDDNPPGLLLCYLAATTLILAFVHTWRKMKYFLILAGSSLIGFLLFAILHNVFYGLAQMAADIIVLSQLLEFLDAGFFLVAIIVCPAGCLVGVGGSVLTYLKQRKIPV
jgi:hypothetical protein